ncbi:MAG: DUF1269 domain-containing protein [Actinomycetota bacterium]|nr:DUF1269 domain-containing protein [Actinomycetota bacterium]
MATLSVWKFETADGADRAEATLEQLQKEELIQIHDAAVVSWPEGKKRPKTRELHNLAGAGALGGAFWGLLFGIIFFIPILGLAVGAAAGAVAGSLAHVGIDDSFIAEVRGKVTPGTSALFVLTSDEVVDKVVERLHETGLRAELVHTNLSGDQEQKVREAFAESE